MKYWILLLFVFIIYWSKADRCFDYRLTDGSENVVNYGIDTTGNWWIKTEPFTNNFRYLLENFESQSYSFVSNIVFSPDGKKWAFYAKTNTQWYLISKDTSFAVYCNEPGFIMFSKNSEKMIYSYFENEIEIINFGDKTIKITNRLQNYFFTDYYGNNFATMGYRGKSYVLIINGKESEQYDKIIPLGFWHNGQFIYAANSGNNWEIKIGEKIVLDGYADISEAKLNFLGTAAGFIAKTHGHNSYGIMISDEYFEPLITKNYESAYNIELHPYLPMMAFNATKNGANFIIYSNTEYTGGEFTSKPFFTHDGQEMFYFGCNIDCFINIGGVKYTQNAIFTLNIPYSHKPNSSTIGYTSSSALLVRHLTENRIYSGMMVDETTNSIYNWKKQRYEALGRINNKIYLLTCNF